MFNTTVTPKNMLFIPDIQVIKQTIKFPYVSANTTVTLKNMLFIPDTQLLTTKFPYISEFYLNKSSDDGFVIKPKYKEI